MSSFVTELRRELVEAAERERRRRAPRHVLARTSRVVVAAAASVLVLVVALAGIAVLGREHAPPAGPAPRIVATIHVGGQPVAGSLGAGSVWVADATGRVLRLDPASRRVTATFKADTEADAVSATDGAVWVSTRKRSGVHTITRIDPATNRIVDRVETHSLFESNLAAGSRYLWLQLDKQPPVRLQRIDPRVGRPSGSYGRRWLAALAVHDGVVWSLSVDGVLERRDADTGKLLSRSGGFGTVPPGSALGDAIAPGDHGAWVVTGGSGELHRVSAAGRLQLSIPIGANAPIATTGRSLWVLNNDVTLRRTELIELDARTGKELGRLALGAQVPRSLVAVGDEVWAVIGDGTILVIR
jgi:outer membrane protein assembly factor BamB